MLKEGEILEGKYKIGRLLGKGGMGAVFFGEHTRIKRAVAIKVLRDVDPESENVRRFEREAQAAGTIGSDHIVEVLDLGTTPDGDRFMVMEYLDGESLKARLKRGRLKPAEVIPLVSQILEGLAAAHAAGIVHRDLKPDNVFILKEKAGRRDFVKIVDFGISKFSALGDEGGMTKTGAVMGTPYYMSPEQARASNEVDHRSDLYSVGVLMYEAVTSTLPFHETTLTALLFKIVFDEPPHPCTLVPDLDPAFAALILKAMARNANDRYQTASAFLEGLSSWREGPRAAAAAGSLPLPPSVREPAPPVVVPQSTVAISGGTAILEASPVALQPPPAAPPPPQPVASSVAPSLPQAPAVQTPLAQPPPKSRALLFALAAVGLLGLGGGAVFLLVRPSSGATAAAPAASAISTATATPTATATSTSTIASAAATASASPTEAPSAAPTASAAVRPGGARPLPSAKPSAAPAAAPSGKLKDLGY